MRMVAVAVIAIAMFVGACEDGSDSSERGFTVIGTEMAFEAPATVDAGTYDVTFRNAGSLPHELAFRSPDGEFVMRRSIAAGAQVTMQVQLESHGTWELGCFEPGHYEAGMHEQLVVT